MEEDYVANEEYAYDETYEYDNTDEYVYNDTYATEYEYESAQEYEYAYEYELELVQIEPASATVVATGTLGIGGAPWTHYSNGHVIVGAGTTNHPGNTLMNPFQLPGSGQHGNITSIEFTGPIVAGSSMRSFFRALPNLVSIQGLELIDTRNVTNMQGMFVGTPNVTTLDLSSWDTRNVTNMAEMFSGVRELTTLDLSGWDVRNVTNMQSMFQNASSLATLNLSGWDTRDIVQSPFPHTPTRRMFEGVDNLQELTLGRDFRFAPLGMMNLTVPRGYVLRNVDNGMEAQIQNHYRNIVPPATTSTWVRHCVLDRRTIIVRPVRPGLRLGSGLSEGPGSRTIANIELSSLFTDSQIAAFTIENLPVGVTAYLETSRTSLRLILQGSSETEIGVYDDLVLWIDGVASAPFTLPIVDGAPEVAFSIVPHQPIAAPGSYVLVSMRMDTLRESGHWQSLRAGLHYDSTRLELVAYTGTGDTTWGQIAEARGYRVGLRGDWVTALAPVSVDVNFNIIADAIVPAPPTPTGWGSAITMVHTTDAGRRSTLEPLEIVWQFRVRDNAPAGVAEVRWWLPTYGDILTHDAPAPADARTLLFTLPQPETFGFILIGQTPASTEITLTYDANGGTGTMADRGPFERGQLITASPSAFTNPGWVQVGWRLDHPTNGAFVPLGNSFVIRDSSTLYAEWAYRGL